MKFLDQIAELEAKTAGLNASADHLQEVMNAAIKQLGEVQAFLANAPTPFTVTVNQNGSEIVVSEKDGMALFAALVRALEGERPQVRLANGQTPQLALTDLEQVAAKIIEAMA